MDATTQLSAVNGMLATIGEAPINTLSDTSLVDVAVALQALDEVTRAVLTEGWKFNTDFLYPLSPEAFSPFAIKVPPNALVVQPSDDFPDITVRGARLYDTVRFSFSFQGHPAVPCKVIWMMDFEELPEVTRQYVYIRAARLFQTRTTASELLHAFTSQEEQAARMSHMRNNTRVQKKNFLNGSHATARVLKRGTQL